MDREVKEQYQVLIQAKDMGGQLGGLAGTTIVNITLTDVNDNPPRFPKSMSFPVKSKLVQLLKKKNLTFIECYMSCNNFQTFGLWGANANG